MSATSQRRLALIAAGVVLTVFLAANAHLLVAAIGSQPDCVLAEGAATPAKRSC